MSGPKAARLTVAATVMLAILPLSAAQAADTYYFKDILRPHGQARSMSAKLADGRLPRDNQGETACCLT